MKSHKDNNKIFVYGTLRKDPHHEMYRVLAKHCRFIGDGVVNGNLYDLGDYPGLVLSSDPAQITTGEVYEIVANDGELIWKILDQYEGCGPQDPMPHQYGKLPVNVTLSDDTSIEAMTYILDKVPQSAKPIVGGDYLKWKNR